MNRILVVDDDFLIRQSLLRILSQAGYRVQIAETGTIALNLFEQFNPDLVFLDLKLPDADGLQLLSIMKQKRSNIIAVMLTAHGDVKNAVQAMRLGAYDYLSKPVDREEILIVIQKALQTARLTREVRELKEKLNERDLLTNIIGESVAFRRVLEHVRIIAGTDVTVLIEGETGTGKEIIAELIHDYSLRRDHGFVAVDCGAIPETLFESELFGYERGAFTGASQNKPGKFELADKGTLFLDEINNLPLNMQAKLLRVLEKKCLSKLGSKKEVEVDVRIIAASNQRIIDDVRDGKFRSDLFYRLHEYKIDLPRLAERRDDIPLLIEHFRQQANLKFNKQVKGFDSSTMKQLIAHDWPGNVRELRNAVNRAVLLAQNDYINQVELLLTRDPLTDGNSLVLNEAAGQAEKEAIMRAMEKVDGNKVETAKILGISRRQLYRKLHKYNLTK
ncbi:MAG: sigma-54-dependent Fis family transcriptional regulator [Candidatus Cloacimonetes bacterium]|nr:sigma-54-dependent Fis family transcriptional regulator [Candidatus Cloacimonadota bacterium]